MHRKERSGSVCAVLHKYNNSIHIPSAPISLLPEEKEAVVVPRGPRSRSGSVCAVLHQYNAASLSNGNTPVEGRSRSGSIAIHYRDIDEVDSGFNFEEKAIVIDGETIEYENQGDNSLYTDEAMKKRAMIFQEPAVQEILELFWKTYQKGSNDDNVSHTPLANHPLLFFLYILCSLFSTFFSRSESSKYYPCLVSTFLMLTLHSPNRCLSPVITPHGPMPSGSRTTKPSSSGNIQKFTVSAPKYFIAVLIFGDIVTPRDIFTRDTKIHSRIYTESCPSHSHSKHAHSKYSHAQPTPHPHSENEQGAETPVRSGKGVPQCAQGLETRYNGSPFGCRSHTRQVS